MNAEPDTPILSICIPTYNRPELLLRTLRSVCIPSDEIEVIVTDNSEGGQSGELVKDFFKDAPCEWKYHKNDFPAEMPNFDKMVGNLNRCAELARGRYIYIIHDDDFVVENGIQTLLKYLKGPAADYAVIRFAAHLVNLQGDVQRTEYPEADRYLEPKQALNAVLSDSSYARFPSVIFRRDVYDVTGGWREEAAGPIDFDMFVRAFREFGVMEFTEVLGCYTIHDQAQTMNLFTENMVKRNLWLFDQADPKHLLSADEFAAAKALFFHQFILGGTFRLIRWRRLRDAKTVMRLFRMDGVRELPTPMKWAPVKLAFALALVLVPSAA
jgi:glycosyltransferase involved in cell wall biosynthesis